MKLTHWTRRTAPWLLVAPLLLATGCRTGAPQADSGKTGPFGGLTVPNPMEWGAEQEGPRTGNPERLVATWIDTVRQQAGEAPERGFGGRVYFYDKLDDPILVDGRMVVYAFDESNRAPTDHKPTRRYIFPADQLELLQSDSNLGPSYSVWLPWDGVDGPTTEVSLIARFEPNTGGSLVVSEQARERLPGRTLLGEGDQQTQLAQSNPTASPTPGSVQTASFDESSKRAATGKPVTPQAEAEEPRRRLSTTTIRRKL